MQAIGALLIDSLPNSLHNFMMSIDSRKPPTQEAADSRAVLDRAFKGKPVDPEVVKRIRARAAKVREELRKGGETDFTLDLLHESRDE